MYLSYAWPFLQPCTCFPRALHSNKAVGTICRDLSKPCQRRQGPDPRPLWMLVGTPSFFGHKLAHRLRVSKPTLAHVTIYFWYYVFITKDVSVLHFYDLAAWMTSPLGLAVKWIIYIFLMCVLLITHLLQLVGRSLNLFNHTSWVSVASRTYRLKSVSSLCVIDTFGGVLCWNFAFFIFCWYKSFSDRTDSDLFLIIFLLTITFEP